MNRIALCFFGSITCSLALASCGQGVSREIEAVVLSLDGPVSVRHARNSRVESIQTHSRLSVGDLIKVSGAGQACLQILPGILGSVKANSELQIEELRVDKDGNAMVNAMLMRKARLRLRQGILDAVVEKKDAAGATLIVDTPFGVVSATGECVCRITVTNQRARIVSVRGQLQLQATDHVATALDPGFFEDWPNLIGGPKAADSEVEAQEDLVEALGQERLLLLFENRARFAPRPWRRGVAKKP